MDTQATERGSSEALTPETAKPGMSQKTKIKLAVLAAIVLLLGVSGYYYKSLFVAATVNGSPISRLSIVRQLEKQSGKQALDATITQKLIDAELQKKGITVSADEFATKIKEIEARVQSQGGTLDQALTAQGMTRADFEKQLTTELEVQKALADKTTVSDAEVDQYMTDNKVVPPKGQEAVIMGQVKAQLQQDKFSQAASAWVSSLKAQATINYYVQY